MFDTRRTFTAVDLSGVPERIPLLPVPGSYQHPTFGTVDLSAERIATFVANHNQRVYQDQIPIDAEHQTKLSGALGYLGDARVEPDGSVSALVQWTPRGESLVRGGGFKYVSPEWYEGWTAPDTGERYENVLIGAAVTTRPFFKDRSLPRMVATEDGPVPPDGGGDEQRNNSGDSIQAKEQTVSESTTVQMTEEQVNSLIAAKLDEQAARFTEQYDALGKRFEAVEAENVALKTAARLRGFREEVMGRSDANGTAWFGDIEMHINILDSLSDDQRQQYIEQQRETAKRIRASGIFGETGSGHGKPDGKASALDEINARAAAMASEKGITHAQAFTEIITTDAALAKRYAEER